MCIHLRFCHCVSSLLPLKKGPWVIPHVVSISDLFVCDLDPTADQNPTLLFLLLPLFLIRDMRLVLPPSSQLSIQLDRDHATNAFLF